MNKTKFRNALKNILVFLAVPLLWLGLVSFDVAPEPPKGMQFLPVIIQPFSSADYGVDTVTQMFAPMDADIITDAQVDLGETSLQNGNPVFSVDEQDPWEKRGIGYGPDDNPGNGPNDNPGNGPNDNPGNDPNDNPGNGPDDNPGNGPDDNPGNGPDDNPGNGPNDNPGNGPNDNPGNSPNDNPGNGNGPPEDNPGNGNGPPEDNPGNGKPEEKSNNGKKK